jgi:hypothetical protein
VGRRLANGDGRPAVLTAIGQGEKLFALLPLAVLSVASVVGLANGDGDPAASPAPVDRGTTSGPVGHEAAVHHQPVSAAPTARPSISKTATPVDEGEDTSPETIPVERDSNDEPPASSPRVEPPESSSDSPAEAEPPPSSPTSPTTPPDTTEDDGLTKAQATVQCLQSGISTLDVVALAECVEDLLGG